MMRSHDAQSLFGGLKVLGVTQVGFFALAWIGFGVFSFITIHRWGLAYDRRVEAIARGEVQSITLHVRGVHDHRKTEDGGWLVSLEDAASQRVDSRRVGDEDLVRRLEADGQVTAYRFEAGQPGADSAMYHIPLLDRGGHHWGKWVFLGFGLLPVPVGAGVWLFGRRRRANLAASPAVALKASVESIHVEPTRTTERASEQRTSHPPKTIRSVRILASAPDAAAIVPPAFSADRLVFEREPADGQLVALLGDGETSSDIRFDESPRHFSARYGLIPMKFVVPWMVLVVGAMTALPLFVESVRSPFFYAMIAMAWIIVLPAMFSFLHLLNRHFASKGDLFRVNKIERVLELPQLGVALKDDEIMAFVQTKRWVWRRSGSSDSLLQTSVLRRVPDGGFELYPVLRETSLRLFQRPVADRLAEIFGVPVRRTKLGWRASRRLGDAQTAV